MNCKRCGALIPDGVGICGGCGAPVVAGPGETKFHGNMGATVISGETMARPDMGVTRIYQEKDLGKTVVFQPKEKRVPIFGWLVVMEGLDAWREFRLSDEEGQLFLGSGVDCQLKLEDPKVEKMHASLRIKDGMITITDLDTLSGTFVNEETVTKCELKDGDMVKAGESAIRFRKC